MEILCRINAVVCDRKLREKVVDVYHIVCGKGIVPNFNECLNLTFRAFVIDLAYL